MLWSAAGQHHTIDQDDRQAAIRRLVVNQQIPGSPSHLR